MIGIGKSAVTELVLADQLIEQKDGTVTVGLHGGGVMSVQPDGTVETRPAGTAGPYERATVAGQFVVFCPDKSSGRVFAFPFVAKVTG